MKHITLTAALLLLSTSFVQAQQVWVNPIFNNTNMAQQGTTHYTAQTQQERNIQQQYQSTPSLPEVSIAPPPTVQAFQPSKNIKKTTSVAATSETAQSKTEKIDNAAEVIWPKNTLMEKTKWTGRANLGASLQTGNTEQNTLFADVELKAEIDEKRRARVYAEYNRQENDDTLTQDNRSLDFSYDQFFSEKWFLEGIAEFEQDELEQLDLRSVIGAGLGYQLYKSDDLNLKFVAGPAYLRQEYETGRKEDSLTGKWSLDYDQKVLESKLNIYHNHNIFVPVDDTGAFLFESKTGVRIPIHKGIIGTSEIDFDWNNDPVAGVTEDDTRYSVKLGYEW